MTGPYEQSAGEARLAGKSFVSPITAWEIGLLTRGRRQVFAPDPQTWFDRLVDDLKLTEVGLTSRMLLDSSLLPGELHSDPADRMLIATARALDCALMSGDRVILAYAGGGYCKAVPC